MKKNGVFISWESHTRSKSLAELLNIPLFEIVVPGNRLKRYLISTVKTLLLIKKQDPKVVLVQNPSILLAAISIFLLSKRRRIVMDAHNAAVYPLESRYPILNKFACWLLRKSSVVLVTNDALHRVVRDLGANPFVLPDPIPSPPIECRVPSNHNIELFQVVLVCTWAMDEPYTEFLEAARLLLKENVQIKITGKAPERVKKSALPDNVILTGFISKDHYWRLLGEASIIVDLTSRENCLVCGAYESAAVGVPCVLSDTRAARDLFTGGYVFVENKALAIATGILSAIENHSKLKAQITKFSSSHSLLMRQKSVELRAELEI